MTRGLAARVRTACCVLFAAALAVGCSAEWQAQPSEPSSTPGMESGVPTIEIGTPSPAPSRSSRTPGNSRVLDGLPDPRQIDQKNATEVSKAALTIMHTVDSTVDEGLRDARLRSAPYLTPDYTTKIKAEPVQYIPTEWLRHRAYLAVRLRLLEREAGAPSDGPTTAYRQWRITTIPTGRDDWRGDSHTSVAYMALTRSSTRDPWRIADARIVAAG